MKAKITEYKGVHFRSRLEVKWCKFFEYLGVTFEYESEIEKTSLGGYVPDFYFKSLKTWIEIKGTNPTDEELTKIKDVCKNTGKFGFVISGYPTLYPSGYEPHLANTCCYFISDKGVSISMPIDEIYQFIKDVRILSILERCNKTGGLVNLSHDFIRCLNLEPAKAVFKSNKSNILGHTKTLCSLFKVLNKRLNNRK
jgi:hypothetical protein